MIEAAVLGKDQDPSLGHYLQEWLAHTRGRVRTTTYRGYESLIRCYALPALGEQPGFVLRPRLLQEFDNGLTRKLILVCAPAGFGKTALLADWARRGRRPVAWLSLDAGDNDPARFWRHAVAALDRVRPGIAERIAPLLGPLPPPSFEGLVTVLINELAARAEEGEVLTDPCCGTTPQRPSLGRPLRSSSPSSFHRSR